MFDETELLIQFKKKNKNAIRRAIEVYTPYLCIVLYNAVGNGLSKEDIEEIVSDVFFVLWQKADYIDLSKGSVRSYIAAAARNFALKKLNGKTGVNPILSAELCYEKCFDEDKIDEILLWDAVMKLGEPDSEIFVRYYKFGEKIRTISQITGLNISTVKSKLLRGKIKLRKILMNEEN